MEEVSAIEMLSDPGSEEGGGGGGGGSEETGDGESGGSYREKKGIYKSHS